MKKLNIRQFGIGTLTKFAPLISSDSKYVFTIGDGCVYVWIVKTGECLRLIDQNLNSISQQIIVSIAINPNNRLQLCVGEQNGNISIWDYEDGILIQTIKLEKELIQLNSIPNKCLYAFIQNPKNIYSLIRIESIRHNCSPIIVFPKLPSLPKSISFDQKGEISVFLNSDGTIIYLLNLINNQMKNICLTKENLSYHEKLTCAQIHPQQECIALGTQSGRIILWFNFLNCPMNEGTISYLHWHSLSVLCLSFSFDGSYLLSGGHECVLVKWIYKKSEPTFRPRLSSPILHLTSSNDQTFYVSTHSDNTIHFIGSHFAIEQTISAINQSFLPQQSSLPAGIHLFLSEKSIVMNSGKPGYLQFMSIENGKLIYNLDIVGENYVSSNEITEQCLFTDIKRLAIHPTEQWLVTFEERSSNIHFDDQLNERKLRFWLFNQTNNQFELNTSITYPHGQETLNQMLFHPNKLQLATTGNDGFVKFWTFIPSNPITKNASHWRCLSGHSHRSYISNALCYYQFSGLNQMNLCCSFEHLVTIWIEEINDSNDQSQYEYCRCLAHFEKSNFVQSIICQNDQILVCHQTLVNLWNGINGLFIKSFSWHVHAVAKDPKSSFIALFEKSFLHFYSFSDGKCHSRKSSLFRRVTAAAYIPNEKQSSFLPFKYSKLIFYIPQQGLKTFVDDDDHHHQEEKNFIGINDRMETNDHEESLLVNLIRQSQNNSQENIPSKLNSFDDLTKLNRKINIFNEQFLSTPAYLLPSIDHYCIESLKGMLLPINDQNQKEILSIDNDHLSTMSVDSQEYS